MKIAAFALTTLFACGLVLGGTFAIIGAVDDASMPVIIATIGGLTGFMIAGVGAGSVLLTSGRDPQTSDGRRFFRRTAVVLAAVTVISVAAVSIGSASGGFPGSLTIAVVLSGLVYVAANVVGGEYLRRRDERTRATRPPLEPLDEGFLRRRVRTLVVWFLGVLVVGVAASAIAVALTGEADDLWPFLSGALLFACIAAMLVSLSVVMRLNAVSREILGTDTARGKRIGRFIRGKDAELSEEERALALRYAPTVRATIAWTAAQSIFLYVGLIATNTARIVSDHRGVDVFILVLVLALAVVGLLVFPYMLWDRSRIGRAVASVEAVRADHSPR